MKYRVLYSPRSRRDLEKIRDYIASQSGDPAIADQFLGKVFDACSTLGALPFRFAVYPYARRWRMMPFGNYLVFFKIEEREVRIGHVRHAAQRPFSKPPDR
jgi:toxin ParE1/3/4